MQLFEGQILNTFTVLKKGRYIWRRSRYEHSHTIMLNLRILSRSTMRGRICYCSSKSLWVFMEDKRSDCVIFVVSVNKEGNTNKNDTWSPSHHVRWIVTWQFSSLAMLNVTFARGERRGRRYRLRKHSLSSPLQYECNKALQLELRYHIFLIFAWGPPSKHRGSKWLEKNSMSHCHFLSRSPLLTYTWSKAPLSAFIKGMF